MDESATDHLIRRKHRRADGAAQGWAVARRFALGLSLTLACQSALAQAMYRIKPIGYLGGCTSSEPTAAGLNGADQVAGTACNASGDTHAFLWKNSGAPMVDLGPDEVGSLSFGTGINASGQVAVSAQDSTGSFAFVSSGDGTPITRVYDSFGGSNVETSAINDLGQLTGYATTGSGSVWHAFVWKNDGSPMVDLGSLGSSSFGYALNASGQVAGLSDLTGSGASHPFLWKSDGTPMQDLGTFGGTTCCGIAVNASGQVAGQTKRSASPRAAWRVFFWRNDGTPLHDLGTLGGPGSTFAALNDSGQVAGGSTTHHVTHGENDARAFVWLNNGTPMKNLGTLGGNISWGNDINSSGQVTGMATIASGLGHAFLWRNDGTTTQDLNALIDPTDPLKPYVTLTSGTFINDLGDILAEGIDSRTGVSAPYLLQGTVLTLNPRSLAFGSQPIHTSSAARSVTMTNTSSRTVTITSIALTGSAAGQFTSTNNCGHSLVGHATCAIKVTFNPTSTGAKSESLNVNGGGGGLRTVSLSGTGT